MFDLPPKDADDDANTGTVGNTGSPKETEPLAQLTTFDISQQMEVLHKLFALAEAHEKVSHPLKYSSTGYPSS